MLYIDLISIQLCVRFMRESIVVDTVCEFVQVRFLRSMTIKMFGIVTCAVTYPGCSHIPADYLTRRVSNIH